MSAPASWATLSCLSFGSVISAMLSIHIWQRVVILEKQTHNLRSELDRQNVDLYNSRNFLRNWHLTDQRIRVLENLEKMKQGQSFRTDELESSSTDE